MLDIGIYTPLRTIVAMALDEEQKGIGDEDRFWVMGLRGVYDITRDVTGQYVTVRLPVEPNKTVPFPHGVITWSKIGLLDDRGQINTLKINNALTTFRDNNPGRLGDLTPDINNVIGNLAMVPYYANYYYGGGCFQLYGVGNGMITYGDCRVDELNRVIILATDFKYDSIMFEYMPSPKMDGDYMVESYLTEAIIMFIRWKAKLATRQEYYAEVTKARRAAPKKKAILQTINQVIRESNGMKLRS